MVTTWRRVLAVAAALSLAVLLGVLAIVRLEPQLPPGVNGVREPELVPDPDAVPEPTPKTRSSTLE